MAIRENPFDEMERLFDQMRRSMWAPYGGDSPYRGQFRGEQVRGERDSRWDRYDGHVNVETGEDGYVVFADVPGFETEDIDLRFEEGLLTIEATREYDDEHTSRSRRVFERVRVPGAVIDEEITASYRNGALEVHLPVPEAAEDEDATSIEIE